MDLDNFDHQILDLLRQDARRTGSELAEEVGLSPAACLRRLQRLRKIGAIEREIAVLSAKVTGQRVTLIVTLTLHRGRPDMRARFRDYFGKLPEVKNLYHVTGEDDLVLTVECRTMEDYADFAEKHFRMDEIRGYETTVVLQTLI
ncbi:Lrp/AsnC family transcriptional regulator [Pseudooceanicola sp. MF1-13]|uniref:Lrp/AsnC family transcriptional regulator n=1 Tax=Pseudooceanicola sp. MF1-13 TaxID=3379095 RepID=UPI0038912C3A